MVFRWYEKQSHPNLVGFSPKIGWFFILLDAKYKRLTVFACLAILLHSQSSWTDTLITGWFYYTEMTASSIVYSARVWSFKMTQQNKVSEACSGTSHIQDHIRSKPNMWLLTLNSCELLVVSVLQMFAFNRRLCTSPTKWSVSRHKNVGTDR